jgi:hypothetical protein
MVCEHLRALEEEMIEAGHPVIFRGQAWSRNCREWVYFECYIDRASVRNRMELAPCVEDHDHLGTHDGQESGLICKACKDAIMGVHRERRRASTPVFG